jgi:tetratricopeptide (TPR) repeat protein
MGKQIIRFIAAFVLSGSVCIGQTNLTEEALWSQSVINAYKSIQEQHQATMRAVQQAREEAEASAKRRTDALEDRLRHLEQTVVQTATTERDREVATRADSHRFTLIVVGVSAGVGLLGLVLCAGFIVRAIQRRQAGTFAMQPVSPLGSGETGLTSLDPAQQSTARLHSSLDRLEQRLAELEDGAIETHTHKGDGVNVTQQMQDLSARVALLLGKGQALLNLRQVDTALECFDEIIALDPTNAEVFVKKGAALEKLGRLDEAIECYDRAIAVDQSMTMAYLCKGGVFNRLERYGEAVQCYEQALRAQQHLVS